MNKKVISSVLAGAMAVSTMGVVASATDSTNTFTAKAGLKEFTISATIPAELETFINPYGAQVKAAASTTGALDSVGYSDGLISPVYSIANTDTSAGLKVSATAKITPSATVAVNTKYLDEAKLQKATEKQVFAFLNTTIYAANSKPIFASTDFVGNENQVVFTEDGTKAASIMELDKSSGANTTGYFYVGGQCTPNPETAWDGKDTVTVDLILDLVPSAGEKADLSLASIKLGTNDIEKEFDGTKKVYEMAASGSKTKAASIVVTVNNKGIAADTTVTPNIAEVKGASIYVKYNGKVYTSAVAAATTSVPKITFNTPASGTTAANVTVTPCLDAAGAARDYAAGDKIEFIVVDSVTNESATYTINFT